MEAPRDAEPARILIVDDHEDNVELLRARLESWGYTAETASNGAEALSKVEHAPPDLILLDVMMPVIDGIEVARRIKGNQSLPFIPIIMQTALDSTENKVEGLEAGADDYLVKPFAFSELAARINALSRRGPINAQQTRLQCGSLSIDLLRREVRRDGQMISLQPREYRLLEELVRNSERAVTRTMLLERVWGFHFDPQTNIVETHISRMRAKLNEGDKPDLIETIRGVGYRMRPCEEA